MSASRVAEKRGGGPWSEKVEGSEIVPDYDSHMLRCCFYLDNSIESGHRSCRELCFFSVRPNHICLLLGVKVLNLNLMKNIMMH